MAENNTLELIIDQASETEQRVLTGDDTSKEVQKCLDDNKKTQNTETCYIDNDGAIKGLELSLGLLIIQLKYGSHEGITKDTELGELLINGMKKVTGVKSVMMYLIPIIMKIKSYDNQNDFRVGLVMDFVNYWLESISKYSINAPGLNLNSQINIIKELLGKEVITECDKCPINTYCVSTAKNGYDICPRIDYTKKVLSFLESNKTDIFQIGFIDKDGKLQGMEASLGNLIIQIKSHNTSDNSEDNDLGKLLLHGRDYVVSIKGFINYSIRLLQMVDNYDNKNDFRIKLISDFVTYWISAINNYVKDTGDDSETKDIDRLDDFLNGRQLNIAA